MDRAVKQLFSKLFWEQWLILVVAGSVLVLGVQCGLPDTKRMTLLVWGQSLTDRQKELLTSLREDARAKRDIDNRASARRLMQSRKLLPRDSQESGSACVLSEEDRIYDFKRFVLASSAMDEHLTYSILSAMNPAGLDFDPRGRFIYGGAYIYSLGAVIYAAKLIGMIHVTRDIFYYFEHPANVARMYMTGRSFNILAFLGILFLLGQLGKRIAGRLCGTTAMLGFSLSTLALNMCLVSKPHVFAAFWVLLSVHLTLLYNERRTPSHLFWATVAAGWAFGASVVCGSIALLFPILLFDAQDLRGAFRRVVMVIVGMVTIFLLTNPYTAITYDRYVLEVVRHALDQDSVFYVVAIENLARDLLRTFTQHYCFPVGAIGILGLAAACRAKAGPVKRLAVATVLVMLLVSIVLSQTLHVGRISLFLGPLLCLFAGYGITLLSVYLRRTGSAFRAVALVLLFVPGAFCAALFARDVIFDDHWYKPTLEWVRSAGIDDQTTVGVFTSPNPVNLPPFPFLNARLINMNKCASEETLPDYVVVGSYPYYNDQQRWEAHPDRPRFKLAANLGFRPTYRWLLQLRMRTESQTAGWVYSPRNVESRDK